MNILMYLLEKYPEKPWDWDRISEKYPKTRWDWNPDIAMEFIVKHQDTRWNIGSFGISANPNITMEFIEKHPDKPWNWPGISINPNITIEFIEKYINKINFEILSTNKFTYENTRIKKKEGYVLLEKERSFHKLMSLYVIKKYM